MLKPHVPKFRPNLFVRLKGIAEKQVPAKLKPIVSYMENVITIVDQTVLTNNILPTRDTG